MASAAQQLLMALGASVSAVVAYGVGAALAVGAKTAAAVGSSAGIGSATGISSGGAWSLLDGSPDASDASIQRPTILDPYSPVRPPWAVAGVDYAVGPHTGITFKIPGVDTLPTGFTYDPSNDRIHTFGAPDNIVLDGWNLTATGSFIFDCQSKGVILRNCKLTRDVGFNSLGMDDFLCEYCEFDGSVHEVEEQAYIYSSVASSTATFQYCYFHDGFGDLFQASGNDSSIIVRWCLLENWAQGPVEVHGDLMQGRGGVVSNFTFEFNTIYVSSWGVLGSGGSQGISIPGSPTINVNPCECDGGSVSYNTVIPLVDLGQFYIVSAGDIDGTIAFDYNYILRTHFTETGGTFGVFVVSGEAGSGGHHNFTGSVTGTGNIDLADGVGFLSGTLYSNP